MFKCLSDLDFYETIPEFEGDIEFREKEAGLYKAETKMRGRSASLTLFMSWDGVPAASKPELYASIAGTIGLDLPDSVSETALQDLTKALREGATGTPEQIEFAFQGEFASMRIWIPTEPKRNASEEKTACQLLRRFRQALSEVEELVDGLESGELPPACVAKAANSLRERRLPCTIENIVLLAKYLQRETYNAPTNPERGSNASNDLEYEPSDERRFDIEIVL